VGINIFGPADGRALRGTKREVDSMLFFVLFGLLILAATGHMILR
jgi:hypothetical protein